MRLLHYSDDGRLSFTSDLVGRDTIPPYAILSHTWQKDEEVFYDEIVKGSGSKKAGYDKILSCGRQAKRDGLEHFWVDTCCINRAEHGEFQEAVSSMFTWYQHASKCYVFMPDVGYNKRKADTERTTSSWVTAFRSSRWFTRGWTLQELIAPRSVEFFSKEWKRLGDKASLETHIHEVTKIPKAALQCVPLTQFTIEERLKWMENRKTTEPEDLVYCLIGMFGVRMMPLYGEGVDTAFRRLMREASTLKQCLQDIHLGTPSDDKKRIESAKGGPPKSSYDWVLENESFQQWRDNTQSRLLWVSGDAGKGKTMLICGIVDELRKSTHAPLAFFFCQGTDVRINTATSVLRGVIYQLISQQPSLMLHLREKYDQEGSHFFHDPDAWGALTNVFTNMAEDVTIKMNYIIVDGLDECLVDLPKLLHLIVRTTASSSRLKWLVSSRHEAQIEQNFEALSDESKLSIELKQNAEHVARAVDLYIDHRLFHIVPLREYVLREQVRDDLRRKANGTFLWVALVIQELEYTESWNHLAVVKGAPAGLHQLYDHMMDRIQQLPLQTAATCRFLLCTAAVAYRPLYLTEIGSLCRLAGRAAEVSETVRTIATKCRSFITIRDEQVYFTHQSAKDYLIHEIRSGTLASYAGIHYDMFTQSLDLMFSTLKRDMYTLRVPGISIEEVQTPSPDPLANVHYSCVYWADHLYDSQAKYWAYPVSDLKGRGMVLEFISEKYLYWLEALSLYKSTRGGVSAIRKLWDLLQETRKQDQLARLVGDAYRFMMYHRGMIERYPLQTYVSALLFSPKGSMIRQQFQHEEPPGVKIRPATSNSWSVCLQKLEGHRSQVNSVVFSHDSKRLASASSDCSIKIWDASSGMCLHTLEAHRSSTESVAFSHDSAWLASASDDHTVIIWDADSGACMRVLKGHTHPIRSVVFSHNSARLASASDDWSIRIWDVRRRSRCLHTLRGHLLPVHSVAFSHDSARLVSASSDRTVKIWNVSRGECLQTLEGHCRCITSVIFSHDSTLVASASHDGIVKIWNASSGACLQTFEGSGKSSIVFLHDSTLVASASDDCLVRVWDVSSGACLQAVGSFGIGSAVFSHDRTQVASISDRVIEIWNTDSISCLKMPPDRGGMVRSVAFSRDSTWVASGSSKGTIKIWDVSSGACLQTQEGHAGHNVNSVLFSRDSFRLASASDDHTIKIWDTTGLCLQKLEGHVDSIVSIAFSPDSTRLLSAAARGDRTVKIWDTSNGSCLRTVAGHYLPITSVAFSHNSAMLLLTTDDDSVKVYDACNGTRLQTLNDPEQVALLTGPMPVSTLSLSRENVAKDKGDVHHLIITGYENAWISRHGQLLSWIPPEYRAVCSAALGTRLAIGTESGKVWIFSST